jgi:hypothetical protein
MRTNTFCGPPGHLCMECDPARSTGCNGGICACGNSPQCPDGTRCLNNACVCDNVSCPNGCCGESLCQKPSLTMCGIGGHACAPCSTELADGCTQGKCTCGGGSPCSSGQHCVGGKCVCDAQSCPGCCVSNVCMPQVSASACGLPGAQCVKCEVSRANGCTNGLCTCGANAQCGTGQICLNNACVCNAQSCPGCCLGNMCVPGNNASACGLGGVACLPCLVGQQCGNNGLCACAQGTFACANAKSCVQSCTQCNGLSSVCNGVCVSDCATGCLAAPHSCMGVNGAQNICVPVCPMLCPNNGMCQ